MSWIRRTAPQLPVIEPIVPVPREDPFDDPAWLFEPKYDGFRGVLHIARRECWFTSKSGNVLTQFRDLCHWAREELIDVKDAVLDGEIVSLDREGRQDFRALMAGQGNFHYAAFDLLWLNGKDLRPLPLYRRKRALARILPATTSIVSRVYAVEERGIDLFRAAERLDLEGIVAKRRRDGYAPGTEWLKVKNRAHTQMQGRRELFGPRGARTGPPT